MKKVLLISFSGGRTSAYMTHLILNGCLKNQYTQKYDEIRPVFLNTSCEHSDTYRFIRDCVKHFNWHNLAVLQGVFYQSGKNDFIETTIDACDKTGETFLSAAKRYKGFSFLRACTRELKLGVFNRFVAKNYKDCIVDRAIGIRADEPLRYKQKHGFIYPLVEDKPSFKFEILDFFRQFDFDLKIPEYLGNCIYCYCKSEPKLMKAIQETQNTPLFNKWVEIAKTNPQPQYRNYKYFDDLIKTANTMPVIDDLFAEKRFTGGCSESCEFYDLDD